MRDSSMHSPWEKWCGGILLPLAPLLLALRAWTLQHTWLYTYGGGLVSVTGKNAVVLGFFFFAVAGYAHIHFFWNNTRLLAGCVLVGKLLCASLAAVSIMYFFWTYISTTFI